MDEGNLVKKALFIALIGFILLLLCFFLLKPEELSSFEIPEDKKVQFKANIQSISQTSSGSVMTLQRECEQTVFIDTTIPSHFEHKTVLVTGVLSGDFFSLNTIEMID